MITVSRKSAFGVWIAVAISLSAFLLFVVEPLVAKRILPWFGGSAAVWSTCLVFYQTALLGGYFYARLLTRYLSPRAQSGLHIAVLVGSLALLPIGPSDHWKSVASNEPTWQILSMLTATIGDAIKTRTRHTSDADFANQMARELDIVLETKRRNVGHDVVHTIGHKRFESSVVQYR